MSISNKNKEHKRETNKMSNILFLAKTEFDGSTTLQDMCKLFEKLSVQLNKVFQSVNQDFFIENDGYVGNYNYTLDQDEDLQRLVKVTYNKGFIYVYTEEPDVLWQFLNINPEFDYSPCYY